jgi:16S rRNA processing protein RimM
VGHLSKAHGTKGEIFVWPLTDRPESTFAPGTVLHVSDAEGRDPDPDVAPAHLTESRPYRRGYLVRLDGVDDRTAAERLRGRYLLRPFEETDPLGEGELFYHQLLGMKVVTKDGVEVGVVREVYALRPAHLLEVVGPAGEKLIPFTERIVVSWDLASGTLVIDPPEGLLDL